MEIVYVDMDGVLCDFVGAVIGYRKNNPEISYPHSQVDFFRNLEPMDKAIESFWKLYNSEKYDVYILTAPSVRNPLSYMEKRLWVSDNLGVDIVNRLIISPNKGLSKGHFLIDDIVKGKGQEDFEGELIHFQSDKFPNWDAVIDYLL